MVNMHFGEMIRAFVCFFLQKVGKADSEDQTYSTFSGVEMYGHDVYSLNPRGEVENFWKGTM